MNDQFEKILKEHGIYGEDVEEILYAVGDMLRLMADKTKSEEPYAVNTIDKMETSARTVDSLVWYLYD